MIWGIVRERRQDLSAGGRLGFVNPHRIWHTRRPWCTAHEALRVVAERSCQDELALVGDDCVFAVVNGRRSQQPDPAVAMLGVVPGKELLAERPRTVNPASDIHALNETEEGLS